MGILLKSKEDRTHDIASICMLYWYGRTNMKARLVLWQKNTLKDRYILEMKIYEVDPSERNPDGVKYSLILADLWTGKSVPMDNHHPKGPHVHVDNHESEYSFETVDMLVEDFKQLVLVKMGVII